MSWFIVDVESDGPCPGLYSMVSFGAVRLDRALACTFGARTSPLPGASWQPEALAVTGTDHEEHRHYPPPEMAMQNFAAWLKENSIGKPVFVSDNPAFDWQWINYYFHRFVGENPFGFSARRIGDLFAGMGKDAALASKWKHLRKTTHTHDPVDDARGNAEALLAMVDMGLRIPGVE